jgi:enediyne biosynthesis protein E4
MKNLFQFLLFSSLCFVLFFGCQSKNEVLFTQILAQDSKVFFENQIVENEKYNVFDYHNLYNGGGVAAIDINNDGLQDLYFTGNQVADKLYINKGDFEFEDISQQAGIVSQGWSSGVSVVDINSDGLLDIYVCKSGNESGALKANVFWINEGNNHFRNEAFERGLADTTWSTQSAFFDYDHDGDLDMYLLTTSNLVRNPNLLQKNTHLAAKYAVDKLYQNDGTGHFTEVGEKSGILANTHGLGLTVADINSDGWEDILVSSDFLPNDALYINNRNGTFTNMASGVMPFQSRFSMGNDIADLNNDGLPEMISTDMLPPDNEQQKRMLMTSYHVFETEKTLGYHSEFTRNMLFRNLGLDNNNNVFFGEIGQYAGIHATDWSWSPLMVDFDNDGLKDIGISNGYLRDVTDADFVAYNLNFSQKNMSKSEMRAFMNKNTSNLPKLYKKNQFFKNEGNFKFENVSDEWFQSKGSFSNGAVSVDLDNDGDLDYVVNNINEPVGIFRNESKNNFLKIKLHGNSQNLLGQGAHIQVLIKGVTQTYVQTLTRGYLSSVDPKIIIGCGDADEVEELKIVWSNGKTQKLNSLKTNRVLDLFEKDAQTVNLIPSVVKSLFIEQNIEYKHQENRYIDYYTENLLLHSYSKAGPSIAVGDLNTDGLEDIFIAGSSLQAGTILFQSTDGSFSKKGELPKQVSEDVASVLVDVNKDGFLDIYVVAGSNELPMKPSIYQDKLYLNDGKGNFVNKTSELLPEMGIPGATAVVLDIDKDGDLDIFRGGGVKPGHFPEAEDSYILLNTNGHFKKQKIVLSGLIKGVLAVDYNLDSWLDLVLVGEYMNPVFMKNSKGKLAVDFELKGAKGLWNCIKSSDLDNDGDMDFVLGNIGENYRYRFSKDQPLQVYFKSFSNVENSQAISTYFLNDVEQPIHTRDNLIRQIPSVRKHFPNYDSYAVSKINDWLKTKNDKIVSAEMMQSIILRNKGNRAFEIEFLPNITQTSPVKDMLILDINGDGIKDIILGGNDYELEPSNSGYVAGNAGVVLLGNKNGTYQEISNQKSGVWLKGPLKHLAIIHKKSSTSILAAFNNERLKIFELISP